MAWSARSWPHRCRLRIHKVGGLFFHRKYARALSQVYLTLPCNLRMIMMSVHKSDFCRALAAERWETLHGRLFFSYQYISYLVFEHIKSNIITSDKPFYTYMFDAPRRISLNATFSETKRQTIEPLSLLDDISLGTIQGSQERGRHHGIQKYTTLENENA